MWTEGCEIFDIHRKTIEKLMASTNLNREICEKAYKMAGYDYTKVRNALDEIDKGFDILIDA